MERIRISEKLYTNLLSSGQPLDIERFRVVDRLHRNKRERIETEIENYDIPKMKHPDTHAKGDK